MLQLGINYLYNVNVYNVYLGRAEESEEKLRSILAQLEFSHQVCEYDRNGVPFKHIYMYLRNILLVELSIMKEKMMLTSSR